MAVKSAYYNLHTFSKYALIVGKSHLSRGGRNTRNQPMSRIRSVPISTVKVLKNNWNRSRGKLTAWCYAINRHLEKNNWGESRMVLLIPTILRINSFILLGVNEYFYNDYYFNSINEILSYTWTRRLVLLYCSIAHARESERENKAVLLRLISRPHP